MRVSLSLAPHLGTCDKCGAGGPGTAQVLVLPFTLVVDTHTGDADALCADCLFNLNGLRVDVPMADLSPKHNHRKGLRKSKRSSVLQEREVAEELGGRTQPGSGNQPGAKGDIRKKGELRVEAKSTTASSFRLELDDLYKIAGETTLGEKAVLVIDYLEPGTRKLKDRFAVIHFQDLKELLKCP